MAESKKSIAPPRESTPEELEQQAQAKAAEEARVKAAEEAHAKVVAAGEARDRYARLTDSIRAGATVEELNQASDALRPIAQAIQARL